jgi:subtilisin family serine protease
MATPHIAGIAALVKQTNPTFNPAAVSSALTTTAFIIDRDGQPLLAQNPFSNTTIALGPATPFDFGGGAVNATGAVDPGIVFKAGIYISSLSSVLQLLLLNAWE